METNLLIGIAVITVIAFLYLIRLEIRIWRYSTKEHKLRLMWMVIKVATVAGGTIMAVIVYLVMREKLPPEAPGTVLYSLLLATVASYFFLLTHRQLLIKAIKTGKKNGLNKYFASSLIAITVIGLGLIIWHGMMSYFQYHGSLSKHAIEIVLYFSINFGVIAFLAGIAFFLHDDELTKL